MKKILVSLVILITASSLIFATTHAAWTHTVSIKGNTIETGNVEIEVTTKENPEESDWSKSEQNSNLILSGLIPGQEEKKGYSFSLRNISTSNVNFDISGTITDMQFSGEYPNLSELEIRVFDYDHPEQGSDWKTLEEWSTKNIPLKIELSNIATKKIGMEARLKISAWNDWQNQNMNFELQITGMQI